MVFVLSVIQNVGEVKEREINILNIVKLYWTYKMGTQERKTPK